VIWIFTCGFILSKITYSDPKAHIHKERENNLHTIDAPNLVLGKVCAPMPQLQSVSYFLSHLCKPEPVASEDTLLQCLQQRGPVSSFVDRLQSSNDISDDFQGSDNNNNLQIIVQFSPTGVYNSDQFHLTKLPFSMTTGYKHSLNINNTQMPWVKRRHLRVRHNLPLRTQSRQSVCLVSLNILFPCSHILSKRKQFSDPSD
jgi:hypothetical protein